MVFYPVFRKASIYIAPLAFQATGLSKFQICSIGSAKIIDICRTIPNLKSCQMNPLLYFSTASAVVAKKKKKKKQQILGFDDVSDRNLIRVLNSEIKCVVDSDLFTIAVDVPTGFPFKVEDNAGRRTIVLTKESEGENIRIEVDMPSKGGAHDDDMREIQTSIPALVTVSKSDGSCLEFGARCLPDGFSVLHLSLKKSGNSEKGLAYTGPNFLKLNEYLRNTFEKYLERRGLTSAMANFLHEYMMCKDTEEYLRWLRTLKKLIEY